MKKIISLILTIVIIVISVPVFASDEDSSKMQQVLLLVKEKIEIPGELSEFSGHISDYNNKVTYRFEWTSSDYEKSISVTSDDKGRIISYHQNTFKTSDKRISKVSKSELVSFAYDFLKVISPETFKDENDLFVFDEQSYSANGNLMYNIGFKRMKDGIEVKDNYAGVSLCVVDDEIKVRNMNINYNYDTQFENKGIDTDGYVEKYKKHFPVELIYRNEYMPYAKINEPRYEPKLIYRVNDDKIGYMDAITGEVVREDAPDTYFSKGEVFEDSADSMNSAIGGGSSLTPQEMAELEKIEGLLGTDDIENIIKKLPYIKFTDEYTLSNSRLSKDMYGKYWYNAQFRLSGSSDYDYEYFNVKVDAKTGEIYNVSSSLGTYDSERKVTDDEINKAEKMITEFSNIISKEKFASVQKNQTNNYGGNVSIDYVRLVNGVKYINNSISATYNVIDNVITHYGCNFIDAEFANPEDAIGDIKAYDNILEYAPVIPMYVKVNGIYKKVFTLSKTNITVDAISGEIKNRQADLNYNYSDISGHWVESKAVKLAENQIGIKGNELKPEKQITQSELLYLLSDTFYGKYYSEYSVDELYENLIRSGMITEQDKNPDSYVKREDAFVFVIRFAGYEKIAKLENIFKVSYADGAKLSKSKIGHAAILSGLGIICGDGGKLRPTDNLTRAEAITIVYNYLMSY